MVFARSAHERFEVDGANAARDFLRRHEIAQQDIDIVWTAIALHTTPGIPQHMHPVIALVTAGVEMDVLGLTHAEYSDSEREAVVHAHPRTDHFKEFQKNATLSSATMITVEAQGLDHLKQEAPRALTLTLELKAASSRPGYNWIAAAGERPSPIGINNDLTLRSFSPWLKRPEIRAAPIIFSSPKNSNMTCKAALVLTKVLA